MDDIDLAQQNQELFREIALQRHFDQETEEPLIIEGMRHCRDCEERIPVGRLRAYPNAARCLSCQENIERRGRVGRGGHGPGTAR